MMRVFGLLLVVVFGSAVLVGCGQKHDAPPPLTPDQERELEEQLEQASQSEGEAEIFDD